MKKIILIALIPATIALFSCGNDSSKTDSLASDTSHTGSNMTATAQDTNAHEKRTVTDKDVIDFVQMASTGSMMEVQMGNMAMKTGMSQRVKDYGNMLATDHSKAGEELKNMAVNDHVQVPADMMPDQKADMDKLMKKNGAGFDKAYIDMMVKDHKKDIDAFKKAAADLKDDSYKSFASNTLPVLQKHLDSAMAIQKTIK